MKTAFQKVRAAVDAVADSVGRTKQGTFVARREFFYTHGGTAEMFASTVSAALAKAGLKHKVVDKYERWKPFRGGASVAQSSHWGCEFRLLDGAAQ